MNRRVGQLGLALSLAWTPARLPHLCFLTHQCSQHQATPRTGCLGDWFPLHRSRASPTDHLVSWLLYSDCTLEVCGIGTHEHCMLRCPYTAGVSLRDRKTTKSTILDPEWLLCSTAVPPSWIRSRLMVIPQYELVFSKTEVMITNHKTGEELGLSSFTD